MNRSLFAVLVFTFAVRLAVLLALGGALASDIDHYRAVAENLWNRGEFAYYEPRMGPPADIPRATAYRPPLYPILLAPCTPLGAAMPLAIAALHLAMGMGTAALAWHLARRLGLESWAFLVGALVALDPILLRQSTQVMTETTATFLAAASLAALTWLFDGPTLPRATLSGAMLALAALCRPTFLPWLVLCGALLFWAGLRDKRGLKTAISLLVVYLATAAALLTPWAVRNFLVLGKAVFTTTHGGYNLLLGNNPWFYGHLRAHAWDEPWWSSDLDRQWFSEMPRGTPADEVAADRLAYRQAKENIAQQPAMFAYSSLVRLARLYSPIPHRLPEESRSTWFARHAVAIWYLCQWALVLLGVVAAFRNRHNAGASVFATTLAAAALLAVFTGIHAVYWTDMRMRAPLTPVLALLAATGARHLGTSPLGPAAQREPEA